MANLCGANEAIDNALSKALDLKNDILGKLELPASDIAASANSKLTELKSALDGFTVDLPSIPDINVQAEITGLISDIDQTSIQGKLAFASKVAQLKLDFGDTFKDKGLDLDEIISSGTDLISGGGDICALCPNLDIPASASGTGVTTEELVERSSAATLTLTQTPKEILSVQGKKTSQSFFTNINYKQNGLVIVPSTEGTYSEIKVTYLVSLIKEKPINSKQADKKEEKETAPIVVTNVLSVEKKTEFKFSSLIKKLDNVSLGSVDSTKVNSDISSALSAIKSPELKTKIQADLDYAAAERKKLFADPLNYKQVVVPAESVGQKPRVVKVTTPEVQNTVKTETVTKPNPVTKKVETVTVKKTEKSTISINGIAMRKVMIKEKFVTSERADKGWPLVSDMSKLTLKHIPYQIDSVTARPYLKPNSEGITGVKKGVSYYSYNNPQIYGDRSSNDDEKVIVDGTKNITLEPVNKVKQQTVLKIKYIILEKLDPNFKG